MTLALFDFDAAIRNLVPDRDAPFGASRSPAWAKTRIAFVSYQPFCQCCGSRKLLNVHHVVPFHAAPEKELDWDNLITLCEGGRGLNCHLWIGHCGNWRAWNESVFRDADRIGKMLRNREGLAWGEEDRPV